MTSLKLNSRSQGAAEYLLNYGWVLIAVLSIGAGMYYLGIFDLSSQSTTVRASGCQKIKPMEPSIILTPSCEFTGIFINGAGSVVNISSIVINNVADKKNCNLGAGTGIFEPGASMTIRASDCCSTNHVPGEAYNLRLNITFKGQIAGVSFDKMDQCVIYGSYAKEYKVPVCSYTCCPTGQACQGTQYSASNCDVCCQGSCVVATTTTTTITTTVAPATTTTIAATTTTTTQSTTTPTTTTTTTTLPACPYSCVTAGGCVNDMTPPDCYWKNVNNSFSCAGNGTVCCQSVNASCPTTTTTTTVLRYVWQSCQAGTNNVRYITSYFTGYQFTPNVNARVTQLCAYLSTTKTVTVKLQNSAYTVIASASVSGTTGQWRCTSITPVNIVAGQTYYVGVEYHYYVDSPGIPKTCSDVQINYGCYEVNNQFSSARTCTTSYMYGIADIQISTP